MFFIHSLAKPTALNTINTPFIKRLRVKLASGKQTA
jgi:hypothetical protein